MSVAKEKRWAEQGADSPVPQASALWLRWLFISPGVQLLSQDNYPQSISHSPKCCGLGDKSCGQSIYDPLWDAASGGGADTLRVGAGGAGH